MKKAFITAFMAMTLIGTQANAGTEEAKVAASSAVIGAATGYSAAVAAPVTALGCIGTGSGLGTAIGPVGTVLGAVVGLAGYGVYRLVTSDEKRGK